MAASCHKLRQGPASRLCRFRLNTHDSSDIFETKTLSLKTIRPPYTSLPYPPFPTPRRYRGYVSTRRRPGPTAGGDGQSEAAGGERGGLGLGLGLGLELAATLACLARTSLSCVQTRENKQQIKRSAPRRFDSLSGRVTWAGHSSPLSAVRSPQGTHIGRLINSHHGLPSRGLRTAC